MSWRGVPWCPLLSPDAPDNVCCTGLWVCAMGYVTYRYMAIYMPLLGFFSRSRQPNVARYEQGHIHRSNQRYASIIPLVPNGLLKQKSSIKEMKRWQPLVTSGGPFTRSAGKSPTGKRHPSPDLRILNGSRRSCACCGIHIRLCFVQQFLHLQAQAGGKDSITYHTYHKWKHRLSFLHSKPQEMQEMLNLRRPA